MKRTLKFTPMYKGQWDMTPDKYVAPAAVETKIKKKKRIDWNEIGASLVLTLVMYFILYLIFFA